MKPDIDLALKINRVVHNECKDVPHDIGLRIEELIRVYRNNNYRSKAQKRENKIKKARKKFEKRKHPKR